MFVMRGKTSCQENQDSEHQFHAVYDLLDGSWLDGTTFGTDGVYPGQKCRWCPSAYSNFFDSVLQWRRFDVHVTLSALETHPKGNTRAE